MGVTSATRTGCLVVVLVTFGIVVAIALRSIHNPEAPPAPTSAEVTTTLPSTLEDMTLFGYARANLQHGKGACDGVRRSGYVAERQKDAVLIECKNGRSFIAQRDPSGVLMTTECGSGASTKCAEAE